MTIPPIVIRQYLSSESRMSIPKLPTTVTAPQKVVTTTSPFVTTEGRPTLVSVDRQPFAYEPPVKMPPPKPLPYVPFLPPKTAPVPVPTVAPVIPVAPPAYRLPRYRVPPPPPPEDVLVPPVDEGPPPVDLLIDDEVINGELEPAGIGAWVSAHPVASAAIALGALYLLFGRKS